MRAAIRVLVLLLITGCAGGQNGSQAESEQPRASSAVSQSPTSAATGGPTRASERPRDGESVTGVFGADAVEGGCAYLRAADDTRFEVLYPDGWTVVMTPLRLVDPDGNVRARAGDLVTVRGATATDMASICQIGPIFQATEVVAP